MFKALFLILATVTALNAENQDINTARASEVFGYTLAQSLMRMDAPFHYESFLQGFNTARQGGQMPVTDGDLAEAMNRFKETDLAKAKEKALKSWSKISRGASK